MKQFFIISQVILVLGLMSSCSNSSKGTFEIASPDGAYSFSVRIDSITSELIYQVSFDEEQIIHESRLGVEMALSPQAAGDGSLQIVEARSVESRWTPVYGEKNEYPDVYTEALLRFRGARHNYALRIRAYNEGIAFRYEFTEGEGEVRIVKEATAFNVPDHAMAWVSDRAQSEIVKIPVSAIDRAKDRPVLLQYSDSLFIAIGEAALIDYARMKITNNTPGAGNLKVQLDGEVQAATPFNTPWRFVMAARQPGRLIENNYLLLNLNEASKIKDESWIKPGKVIREVTLTTRGGMACVDFAVRHNLQYVEFDAGWYGHEYEESSDATTVTVDPKRSKGPLSLQEVIDYADERGVGVLLYVNRRALEKQLDEVLPLLKSWGVKGIKYGFVNVGPQEWTSWLHDAVRKAADHELMIDIHDEYRPTGYSRTYPNLMTQEGIRGDEESPTNAMVLNTLFTRMIAGAGDHTNCYFAPRVEKAMGSHASQLAKAVCIYSPWQFLYWYDRPEGSRPEDGGAGGAKEPILELPELVFFDRIPTVWDDTRVLEGYPGEYAVVARKSGDNWFLGALNGDEDRLFEISLDFLDKGKTYNATIFSDDASLKTRTNVKIERLEVQSKDIIRRDVLKLNGVAIMIEAVD